MLVEEPDALRRDNIVDPYYLTFVVAVNVAKMFFNTAMFQL